MKKISLQSPAKVNLYLKVLNKRPDGFHNIVTLFERINIFDTIELKENHLGKIRIFCSSKDVPTGPKNLVYKVAQKFRDDFAIETGVDIKIVKRIPVAAGMAGGSTNAATVLLGLNRLWNLRLSQRQLTAYASTIGSDVAFFLYDSSWALGTQRGEKIKPVSLSQKLWHVLVIPRIKLYAKDVYGALKLQLTKKSDDVNILLHHLRKSDLDDVSSLMTNDLESAVMQICPQLLTLKSRMEKLGLMKVLVSGSGPCIYGLARSEQEALGIKRILNRKYSRVFVAHTF
jgi:4-diphosphocytidyl-2-C-methyl-D-erythritol kinase